jgi:hypothetical protein
VDTMNRTINRRLQKLEGSFDLHESSECPLVALLLARRKRLAEKEGIPYVEPRPSTSRPRSLIEALTTRRDFLASNKTL